MIPLAALRSGGRHAALPLALVVLLLPSPAAHAQRLLTLVSGVEQAASTGALGPSIGPLPTAVQVDLELLRAAPARLEVPTPEGDVLSAQRSVFEDRGNGDLMWSGGQPGAGYDTVVLTVEGGRMVGRFGAAGGGVYQIHSERNGRGGMTPLVGPALDDWCGADAVGDDGHEAHAHVRAGALVADLPEPVSNPQSHDRLDILVAYTTTAAENWADRGGAHAAIRHAGDYLKMVFRNNALPVEPHIVHIARASSAVDRVVRDRRLPHESAPLIVQMSLDGDLLRLRHEHRADLVHLFTGEPVLLLGVCGLHSGLGLGMTARSYSPVAEGWTAVSRARCPDYAVVFAHEIGHGLGAAHDRPNAGVAPENHWPYGYGHFNFDIMPSIGTAMSYQGQVEPFFSTPRIRPHGAVVGIVNERDNERVLRETVHLGVRYSDYLRPLDGLPAPPSDLQVRLDGGAVHLAWRDNAPEADGYEMVSCFGVRPLAGRTEATVSPRFYSGQRTCDFMVRATRGGARSLRSNIVRLQTPGHEPSAAPSGVSVTVTTRLELANVAWTDNSDNELLFFAELLRKGELIARTRAPADSESTHFWGDFVEAQTGAEYTVRVFAFNSAGDSENSEEVTFRWAHPDSPGPIKDFSARAIGPTTVRVTWTPNSKGERYEVSAYLRGWRASRSWNEYDRLPGGAAWMDFKGLARGGRYKFEIFPYRGQFAGRPSSAYLTLGERGAGPAAPSDVSWDEEGNRVRVSWKDNSSDELGFEIQSSPLVGFSRNGQHWTRDLTVPADTESADFDARIRLGYLLRVFAYNERGYSVDGPREQALPMFGGLIATPGDTEVRLSWRIYSAETATGMQVRWKVTVALPFDDTVDAWTDLPASASEYTVRGLEGGTEYTFEVRAVAASGPGLAKTATATPYGPLKATFRLDIPCDDDLCRTLTDVPVKFVDTSSGNVTEWHWSFGDGATSDLRSPTHAWSTPGFYTATLTVSDGSSSSSATRMLLVEAATPAGSCRADAETRCLRDSRFEVKVEWWNADGESGAGRVVFAGTNDSGLFRFFDPENWEVLIKVLDGCQTNGRFWVLGASTTDLGYSIRVTDTVTGESRWYRNEPGRPAPAIVDTEAFSLPCGGPGP